MRSLQIYDFAMGAGGSFVLPTSGAYFRILTATGNVNVIGDTFGKLGPINKGQGLENTTYNRLTIVDASGSANAGTILVSDANFIDQTLYGSVSLSGAVALDAATLLSLKNIRPEAYTGSHVAVGAMAANTPVTIVAAGTNVNGVIVQAAQYEPLSAGGITVAFLAKATAPTSVTDGDPLLIAFGNNAFLGAPSTLAQPVLVPAGRGIFAISNAAETGGGRSMLYKVL